MPNPGKYFYGLTEVPFRPDGLKGLGDALVHTIEYREIAAVVSDHPLQELQLVRGNLRPHHRVVRQCSEKATFIPVRFGHICKNEEQILDLLRDCYADIREELKRLSRKAEMAVKLFWDVDNIFEYFVNQCPDLRRRRDAVIGKSRISLAEKLDLGVFFEAQLNAERRRLGSRLIEALREVTVDVRSNQPGEEKMVLDVVFLIERGREKDFESALYRAAGLFDSTFALDYSGPWPPYSFVTLKLELGVSSGGNGWSP